MKIAAKEADETKYWLLLCQNAKSYPNCEVLKKEKDDNIKILFKIISTSKKFNSFSNLQISTFSN